MSRNLTKKQRIFVQEYAKTGHGVESAAKAHNLSIREDEKAYRIANAIATDNIQKPAIISALDALMNDEKLLAKVHREGLKASTWYSKATGKGRSELVKKPDYHARHKYLDTAMKIKRKYSDMNIGQALIVNIGGVTASKYGINTSPDAPEEPQSHVIEQHDTKLK